MNPATNKQSSREAITASRTMLLTTYRRDGRAVGTPVGPVPDGPRILVFTPLQSGKAKRIRSNGRVTIAPCTYRGEPTGETLEARARVLEGGESIEANTIYHKKHPIVAWVAAARYRRKGETPAFLEIVL